MAKTTNPHAGGEEWRVIEGGPAIYDPTAHDEHLAQARKNIETFRKSDCTLRLTDRAGRPMALPLKIKQKAHSFPFGDNLWSLAVDMRDGKENLERSQAWQRLFRDVFNAANNLCYWTERPGTDAPKMEERQGERRLESFAKTVDWTLANGMMAKGHPLFWSLPKAIPEWVKGYGLSTQLKFVETHVRSLVARFRGRVRMWDAVNEPLWEAALKNLPNRQWPHIEPISNLVEYIRPVLQWAREEDPSATFILNEYGLESDKSARPMVGNDGSEVTAASQRKRFLKLAKALAESGTAPDALGMQSHTGWISHEEQWRVYDELSQSGLPLHITEFWASTKELEKSGRYSEAEIDEVTAEYVANFMICAFGHPSIEAFFSWGFMRNAVAWNSAGAGYKLKPLYERIRRLIHNEWNTSIELVSGAEGIVQFRGFHGEYELSYNLADGSPKAVRFSLPPGEASSHHLVLPISL